MRNQTTTAPETTAIDEQGKLPSHVEAIFGEPPVLSTENRDIYQSVLLDIANQIRPQTIFEWSWVKDLTDLIWEIRRYRWQIILILQAAFKPALKALLKSTERALCLQLCVGLHAAPRLGARRFPISPRISHRDCPRSRGRAQGACLRGYLRLPLR